MAASTQDMSAQLAQHAPVRLLIAERTENAAYEFDSLLRDAGIATRLEVIDLPMALEKLPHADMLLCNASLPQLHQLLPRLASIAPQVPVILVNNGEVTLSQSEGMELGAADVVSDAEGRHLVLVVKRELENVCQNLQLKQMKKALDEAEQRCQLLLQSSRAAIAYVHEGMHIYANEGYLQLFGFKDADDLLGLSLIDLLNDDSGSALKDQLKQFRRDEKESNFDFVGHSSDGTTINGNMALAVAEYEGEHCLQVTVRVDDANESDPASNSASKPASNSEAADLNAVPVLLEDAIVAEREAVPATAATLENGNAPVNGSAAEQSLDSQAIEFELELEDTGGDVESASDNPAAPTPASARAADQTESDDQAETEARSAEPEMIEFTPDEPIAEVEAVSAENSQAENSQAENKVAATPAVVKADAATVDVKNNGTAMPLADFLAASENIVKTHDGEFVSVFAAQIDGYEDLQRAFGLSGVNDACRRVEARLLENVDAPFMRISPHQWAMLVYSKTREDALECVDGYRAAVEAMMFEVREKTVRPSCTFGGAILNTHGTDSIGAAIEATLDKAFGTLRTTLDSSEGNSVELPAFENADQEFDDEANRVLALISEAIENQSFTLLFQPIISLRGDSDEHYEVFLRMNDRNGHQMAPGEFLRTAIDNGVAGKIDRWVILQSIKMLSSHRANGHNTRLTINLTSNSVADPEFIQWLGVAIKAARLPSDAVIFQITERDASSYIRQTREFVEGLKNLHCRSSLSRFGLEAEPFEVLNHIPVDFVKLDGTLIEALDKDVEKKEEVAGLVRELQNAGKLTIVPMVESASLLSTLWQAGVNYIQGHYLQEPSANMDYDFSTDD